MVELVQRLITSTLYLQLSNEVEQLHDAHEGLQIAYRELSEERDILLGERDMVSFL